MPKTLFDTGKLVAADEIILCSGLPYDRSVLLSEKERQTLLSRSRLQRKVFVICLLGILVCIVLPIILWLVLNASLTDTTSVNDIVAIVTVTSLIFGIPVFAYLSDRALKRYRVLNGTLFANHVRRFVGVIDKEDWTNGTYDVLKRTGHLREGEGRKTEVDLHAADDILFKINDNEVERWTFVELTKATAPPDSPARFKAPIDWVDPERKDDILRRRLTASERDEIYNYAKKIRRRRWWQLLIVAWLAAAVIRPVGIKIFELEFPAMFAIWAATTIPICAFLFYRQTHEAELYDEDRSDGWAVSLEPNQISTITDGEKHLTQAVEILPFSGATWTIGGKPAGWRKHS